jgi:uncharacterized protein (DUF2141 family)
MKESKFTILILTVLLFLASCAKMGKPDGGWYDETPPRVVGASPAEKSTGVKAKTMYIYFSEFIKMENASEKVVVSPPQLEAAEITSTGKRIKIELKDSLKENTTYTVDFSDAISDNNEGNPLGNFTYTFSTGSEIDTMEVSGYVLESENLEPIKGILVGLYSNLTDTIFKKSEMLRVSRSDSRGHFVIKGVAPGKYRIYALQDVDGNFVFNQKSEKIAFSHDIIVPSCKPDTRQDTLWKDSLHINTITPIRYTHYYPDDIVLRAFTEQMTDRYFIKSERKDANHFTLFFSYGDDNLPQIKGLNFNADNAFVIESSAKKDTLTYWLRDTALVNQDTLSLQISYMHTDSMGILQNQTDTLEILAKTSYEKRLKKEQKEYEKWEKAEAKKKEKGLPYDSVKPKEFLKPDIQVSGEMDPDKNILISFPTPLARMDTSAIHLYSEHDSLWYRSPFEIEKRTDREYVFKGEWRPDIQYSLEIDSLAFEDIYGAVSDKYKQGFKIKKLDEYSSLLLTLNDMSDTTVVVQLLDGSDKVVKEVTTSNGQVEFYYVTPGSYYLRLFVDSNKNGIWDTGNYDEGRQAEEVYYYPEKIECKAKWDITESWNPKGKPLYRQKPGVITKQKPDKDKKIKNQNAERAKQLGLQYIPHV